jgi:hypothetical protein
MAVHAFNRADFREEMDHLSKARFHLDHALYHVQTEKDMKREMTGGTT